MSVQIGEIDGIRRAYDSFNSMLEAKEAFIEENSDPDDGEPECGYSRYDETITDYNYELAYLGEQLAAAVAEALGIEEDS
ncbi:hypothetical protein SEA_XIANYUE_79 [Mycobacterium phage XianYue]|nr:hypothetical protein SEA_XIANYUE_79 [Mycobacterium phage XianYue]